MSETYITPSRLTTALACPLRYQRQYLLKLPGGADNLARFQGDLEHRALEAWAKGEGELLDLWTGLWRERLPEGLQGLFAGFLTVAQDKVAIEVGLASVAAEVAEKRPDVTAITRTKEYREAAKAAGLDVLEERAAKIHAQERAFLDGPNSPWRAQARGAFDFYTDGTDALDRFGAWFHGHPKDAGPEILHTEIKHRIVLKDPANDPGNSFAMTGVIDAIYLWPDGSSEVVDYKRAQTRSGGLDHFVQAAVYALTAEQSVGFRPDRVGFHHLQEGTRTTYEVRPDWSGHLYRMCMEFRGINDRAEFGPSFQTCGYCDYESMCRDDLGFRPIEQPKEAEAA